MVEPQKFDRKIFLEMYAGWDDPFLNCAEGTIDSLVCPDGKNVASFRSGVTC